MKKERGGCREKGGRERERERAGKGAKERKAYRLADIHIDK